MKKTIFSIITLSLLGFLVVPAAHAQTVESSRDHAATTAPATHRTLNIACMQTAVDKRDTAVVSAFSTFSSAISSALTTRSAAVKAAWGVTDRTTRRTQLRSAWTTYRSARRAATQALNGSRHTAWATFATDRRACGGASNTDEGSSETTDIQS